LTGRSVDDARRVDAVVVQRSDEGHRCPAAERHLPPKPPAARSPAPERPHVGLGPGLVEEDEPPGINAGLPRLSAHALARDIGAVLLAGEHRFLKLRPCTCANFHIVR
jgi:hypothetical protein